MQSLANDNDNVNNTNIDNNNDTTTTTTNNNNDNNPPLVQSLAPRPLPDTRVICLFVCLFIYSLLIISYLFMLFVLFICYFSLYLCFYVFGSAPFSRTREYKRLAPRSQKSIQIVFMYTCSNIYVDIATTYAIYIYIYTLTLYVYIYIYIHIYTHIYTDISISLSLSLPLSL